MNLYDKFKLFCNIYLLLFGKYYIILNFIDLFCKFNFNKDCELS
jgi:hypothetical protein